VVLVLLAAGCVAGIAPTTRAGSNAPRDNACLPAQEATSIDSGPGAFKASSEGSGTGNATLQPAPLAVEQDSQGRLRWALGVQVTGNVPTATSNTLFGTLDFKLTLGNGQKNFPTQGQSSQVVAAISTWTTAAGPRFKVDIATSTGACLGEAVPSAGIGGPTTASVHAEISATNLDAGRSTCSQQQQQQQAND
jgi:hypothetical protein